MAFIQQDPRLKKDEEENAPGTISGTSGAGPVQEAPDASQEAPGQAPMQPQQSATQPAQNAPQASRGSQAPRSGMATNVQQYVQKNQPQAQRIGGAVTQNITRKTDSIAQQAQQKQKAFQNQIATNQQKLASSKDFAQQQIQNILNPQQQTTQTQTADAIGAQPQAVENQLSPSAEAKNRFQSLLRGDAGIDKTGNINLAAEKNRLESIKNLAGGINTEQGRLAAMKDAFGKNREYKTGQSALDQLILGGTPDAQNKLITDTQQAFTGAKQNLSDIRGKSMEQIKAEEAALASLPEEVQQMFSGANQGVLSEVDQQIQDRLKQRQELAGQLTPEVEEYQKFVSEVGGLSDEDIARKLLSGNISGVSDVDKFNQLQKFLPEELKNQLRIEEQRGRLGFGPVTTTQSLAGSREALDQLNQMYIDKVATGDLSTDAILASGKGKYMGGELNNLLSSMGLSDQKRLAALGYDPNAVGQKALQIMGGRSGRTRSLGFQNVLNFAKELRDKAAGFDQNTALAQAFKDSGIDLAPDQIQSYLQGGDISRGSILSQDEMRRKQLEALSSLGGKTLDPELVSGDRLITSSAEDDQAAIQRALENIRGRMG